MKFFALVILNLAMNSAYAAHSSLLECKVVEVLDSSYFEEALSIEEYAEVKLATDEVGSISAWLGASLYKTDDGDEINAEPAVGFDTIFSITPSHQLGQYTIIVTGNSASREGTLIGRNRDSEENEFADWKTIALLKCGSTTK